MIVICASAVFNKCMQLINTRCIPLLLIYVQQIKNLCNAENTSQHPSGIRRLDRPVYPSNTITGLLIYYITYHLVAGT